MKNIVLILIAYFILPLKVEAQIVQNLQKLGINLDKDTTRIWPIVSLKLSYPQIVSLEGGLIVNLAFKRLINAPLYGPAFFGEVGINSVKSGLGYNFGIIGLNIRPSICYMFFWLNHREIQKRSQYIGIELIGTVASICKLSVGIHRRINSVESDLLFGSIGIGIGL